MNRCSPRYFPYSWRCRRVCANCTASSHICFEARGYLRIVSIGCCRNFNASLGSCCAPPAYNVFICSLTREWMICCWFSVLLCSSWLRCSHMSHETSHSFCMSAAVHLRLDFLDLAFFQILSWYARHRREIHPSIMRSHPMCCCSPMKGCSVSSWLFSPCAHRSK